VISGRPVAELASENLRQFADLGNGSRDIPHIALPTTLSAGEFTPGGAVTSAQGIKEGVVSPRLEIRTVIYDPGLTQATGDLLWASTGLRALDHAVEAIYSARGQSFTDALAVKAAKLLFDHLPGSIGAEGEDRQVHRGQCQVAAWLSNYAALNTGYGLSHAISHKIGPKWEVAHGVTSCVGLPVAMRFMAERAPERFQPLADALGVAFDTALPTAGAMACIDLVEALISALGLPRTLKDVGVEVTDLGELVDDIHREINMFGAVGLPVSREDISGLLHRM
jgi:alcohol dehydrogenase